MLNESQWTVLSPLWRFKSQTLFWTHKTFQVEVQPTGWLGYLCSAGLTGWQRSASRMCSPDSVKIKPSYPPCTECWLGTPVASHSISWSGTPAATHADETLPEKEMKQNKNTPQTKHISLRVVTVLLNLELNFLGFSCLEMGCDV